ncbi:MAG: response regulator [Pseudomonadales bacterium]|nr:response regulator [Pseudomonadales bacterium]
MQRIMVVDDRAENILAIEAVLERPGLEIVKASSGNEALRLLLRYDVALVLLDVQMPGMDGFEVAELMRRNRKTQTLPIIFVTAQHTDPSYAFKGYQSGAVDYINKPFDPVVLESKVNVFLDLARQREELQAQLQEIRELQSQNEALLAAMGDAILAVDAGGRVTFTNAALKELLPLRLEPVEGHTIMDLLTTNTLGDREPWMTSEIFVGCRYGQQVEIKEKLFLRNGQEHLPVHVVARPINTADEVFAGAVLVLRRLVEGDAALQTQHRGRRLPRKSVSSVLRIFDRTNGRNLGRMANLSSDGFKLVMREHQPLGTIFSMSMVLPETLSGCNTMSFEAELVWCQPSEYTQDFRCGFRVVQISEGDAHLMRQLLDML